MGGACASASASSTTFIANNRAHADHAAQIQAARARQMPMQQQTMPPGDGQHRRSASPTPQAQFVLERLMQGGAQEEQLLPPPPEQPTQTQLRALFSQPQEGNPLWEDGANAGYSAAAASQFGAGSCSGSDAMQGMRYH